VDIWGSVLGLGQHVNKDLGSGTSMSIRIGGLGPPCQ
jgi:hypothetical protein